VGISFLIQKNDDDMRIILTVCLAFLTVTHGMNTGANEPIADNELGTIAKECAKMYCDDRDGLALWLVMVRTCRMDSLLDAWLTAEKTTSVRGCAEYLCPDPDPGVVDGVEQWITSGCHS
jgi:hypothetical protein